MTNTKQKATGEHSLLEHFLIFSPVVLLLAIVPNIVRSILIMDITKLDVVTLAANTDSNGTPYFIDTYSQGKAAVLFFFAAAMVIAAVLFCRWLFKNSDRKTVIYLILSGVFMLMTLLSTIFSDVQNAAWFGIYNHAEGFFTILCYFVIFLYTLYAFKRTENYKYIICALFFVVVVNVVLGAFQFFGADLTANSAFNNLFMSEEVRKLNVSVSLLNESGKLYGSLYHYNFMGSFCAIILPIFTTHAFFEKHLVSRIFFIVFDLAGLFLLIGSTSRGGLIGVAVAVIFGIVVFAKVIWKNIKIVGVTVGIVAVIFVGAGFATHWAVFNRIPAMLSDIGTLLSDTSDRDYRDFLAVKSIENTDDGVLLKTSCGSIVISYDTVMGAIAFATPEGNTIDYDNVDGKLYLDDPAFTSFIFTATSTTGDEEFYDFFTLTLKDKTFFCFKVLGNGRLSFIDYYKGNAETVSTPEVASYFIGKEKVGSARGYIWGRTLPLLRDTLLVGFGPDNFIYEFPQNDYLGKYYSYGTPIQIIDKPHNMYLQMAINEGVIALIAFLIMLGFYIIDSLRLYALRKEYTRAQIMGVGVMLGVIAYLGAGFFNDSIISVAPIFWVVLGVGVALNSINRLAENPELAVSKRARIKAEKLAAVQEEEDRRSKEEYAEQAKALLEKMAVIKQQETEKLGEELRQSAADLSGKNNAKKVTMDDLMGFMSKSNNKNGEDSSEENLAANSEDSVEKTDEKDTSKESGEQ